VASSAFTTPPPCEPVPPSTVTIRFIMVVTRSGQEWKPLPILTATFVQEGGGGTSRLRREVIPA
jgi:hypothetical protein